MWDNILKATCTFLLLASTSARALSTNLTYNNPIVYSDFPDNDVFRGPDDAYYFSASSFHFSPGAPILKSWDLINWEFIGHSVPTLDFGSQYNMDPTPKYVGGIWASSMRYRKSNKTWYWIGCVNFWNTYVYSAPSVTGPWTQIAQYPGGTCYYDCGLLFDDDDTPYVVYGNTNVSIAQLAPDARSQVKTQHMFSGDVGRESIEGNRLYKINGTYYILDDWSSGATYIYKSKNIWGPWERRTLLENLNGPLPGGGYMEQGSLVQAPNGQWHFMSFTWNFPSGRIPIMRPLEVDSDGWFVPVTTWDLTYPFPVAEPRPLGYAWTGVDDFHEDSLRPEWEWNHNPDTTKFTIAKDTGLTLSTATVTESIYTARNTLTHRTYGPHPVGTLELDISRMADGDRTGLAVLRDFTSWLEVKRSGDTFLLSLVYNATQDVAQNWAEISNGTVAESITLPSSVQSANFSLWFQVEMDTMPDSKKEARFTYSLDGRNFTGVGKPAPLSDNFLYFNGYRFAIFNFATKMLGGKVTVRSFKNT